MTTFFFGNEKAPNVLIQAAGSHDPDAAEKEVKALRRLTSADFCLIAVQVADWNRDLSPWEAPAVFGKEGFGKDAGNTLDAVLNLCTDPGRNYIIGGYSLAGLFALWAAHQTDRFCGVAAASPSVWFPGFIGYMREHRIRTGTVCLSLGDREEKTRNPVMAAVGSCIRQADEILREQGVRTALEWNPGGHFRDADLRTARAFAWVLNETADPARSGGKAGPAPGL